MTLCTFVCIRNLDIEDNRYYNRAYQLYDGALLFSCYTQHALRSTIFKSNKVTELDIETADS